MAVLLDSHTLPPKPPVKAPSSRGQHPSVSTRLLVELHKLQPQRWGSTSIGSFYRWLLSGIGRLRSWTDDGCAVADSFLQHPAGAGQRSIHHLSRPHRYGYPCLPDLINGTAIVCQKSERKLERP